MAVLQLAGFRRVNKQRCALVAMVTNAAKTLGSAISALAAHGV